MRKAASVGRPFLFLCDVRYWHKADTLRVGLSAFGGQAAICVARNQQMRQF